jgi:hypothetical protein
MMCAGTPGPTKLLSNYSRGKRRRLKVKSSIVLLSANFPLREKIPKLRGFSAIQTWPTFTRIFVDRQRPLLREENNVLSVFGKIE